MALSEKFLLRLEPEERDWVRKQAEWTRGVVSENDIIRIAINSARNINEKKEVIDDKDSLALGASK